MKEPDYNIMMMSTFLGLTVSGGHKEERNMVNGEVVKSRYHSVVAGKPQCLGHDGRNKYPIGL